MALELVTAAAATDVVSAAEAKRFCGIEDATWDTLIAELIGAAVAQVENFTGRALGEQTWRLHLEEFDDAIELPLGPVRGAGDTSVLAVASVKYDDADGVEQTLAAATYSLDLVSDPQLVVLNEGYSWPDLASTPNPVRITFTTGFGTVPEPLKLAVKQLVATWFADRSAAVPRGVLDSLGSYRRIVL